MRKSLPVAVVAVALLAGCSHDSDKSTNVVAAASPAPSLPPMFVPLPAAPTPTSSTTTTTAPGTTTGGGTEASPRPPGRVGAGIEALRTTWITATVTRSGPGSCYGMTSTDGTAYAVYLASSGPLTTGMKVRAKITPGKTAIDCGAGRLVRADRVQIAG